MPFAMVARGELHLSGIRRLKAHLTRENHEHVLAAAKHKTILQIGELVARLAPQPDVPSTLRALPTRTTAPSPAPSSASEFHGQQAQAGALERAGACRSIQRTPRGWRHDRRASAGELPSLRRTTTLRLLRTQTWLHGPA